MAKRGRSQRKTEPKEKQMPAPVPPTSPPVAIAQQFWVTIVNQMSQSVTVSVLNEAGTAESLRLAPFGRSRLILADRVGSYTRDLEAKGRVRIENQNG